MSLPDKLLRLLGTNSNQLRRVVGAGLIPEGFPLVTAVLLGAYCLFYVLAIRFTAEITDDASVTPVLAALVRYGATETSLVAHGEWWRTVTACFLHANLVHLIMNSLALWTVGPTAEEVFGRARAFVLVVVTGTLGMVASVWYHPVVVGVGASGAIFGLIGALVAYALRHRGSASARGLRSRFIPWMIYGIVFGFAVPGVDNAAHLGGLASGAVIGFLVGDVGLARRLRLVWLVAAGLALLLVAASFYLAATSPLVPR